MGKRKGKAKNRAPIGELFHRLVLFIRRLIEAFRHVKTGGKSTEMRARARASAAPRQCPECRQFMGHSPDWRDHLDECEGTGGGFGGGFGRHRRDEDDEQDLGDEQNGLDSNDSNDSVGAGSSGGGADQQ